MEQCIFPSGAIKVKDLTERRILKVNGQRLQHFVERVDQPEEITFVASVYHD